MEIRITQLRKTFGEKVAVDVEAFTVHSGEILGLVGNNGAGKSTLFRLILDLLKADTGTVHMVGTFHDKECMTDVAQTEEWKDWTGAFVDESFLIDYLTPDEYFAFVARISGVPPEQLQEHLQRFEHFMNGEVCGQKKLIRNLSAGNRMKVGIVAALIQQPQVLILDEPFNFLDPSSQHAIKRLLQEYNEQTGATILISSHNLNHTVDICPRIALLENGRIIRDLANHDHSAVSELETYFNVANS